MRHWRILLTHDLGASTCDPMIDAVHAAYRNVELIESGSMQDAEAQLMMGAFDLVLVCLDVPPAPSAGAKLATLARELGLPVVLITRSLRWLPPDADHLRSLPWAKPMADETELAQAMADAIASQVPNKQLPSGPGHLAKTRGAQPEQRGDERTASSQAGPRGAEAGRDSLSQLSVEELLADDLLAEQRLAEEVLAEERLSRDMLGDEVFVDDVLTNDVLQDDVEVPPPSTDGRSSIIDL